MTRVLRNCGDCGVKPGEYHIGGCDVERCPRCGGQSIACPCVYEVNGIDYGAMEETHPEIYNNGPTYEMHEKFEAEWGPKRKPWTGEYPGTAECREYGFWCTKHPGETPYWRPVPEGTPGATEDLNRLMMECEWDPEQQRRVHR